MRIVFDITTPQQVGGGCRPYPAGVGKQGFFSAQVEIMAAESPASNHPELPPQMFDEERSAIYIEGDSKYIKEMLRDWLSLLEMSEEHMLEEFGPLRSSNCPDGCAEIDKFNGCHEITCPRHVNFGKFGDPQTGVVEEPTPEQAEAPGEANT